MDTFQKNRHKKTTTKNQKITKKIIIKKNNKKTFWSNLPLAPIDVCI